MAKQTEIKARTIPRSHGLTTFLLSIVNGLAFMLATILFVATCCALPIAQVVYIGFQHGDGTAPLALFGWLFAAALGITVHELGHAVATLRVRWHLLQVIVGPLSWERQGDRFRLRLENRRSTDLGKVISFPTDLRNYNRRLGIVLSAGILANLLIALLCIVVLLAWQATSDDFFPGAERGVVQLLLKPDSCIIALLQAALVMNLLYALHSMIPFRYRKSSSDGLQLLQLFLKRGVGSEPSFLTRAGLGGTLFRGTRPRRWDGEAVRRLLQIASTPHEKAEAHLCAYYWDLDREEVAAAGALLEHALWLIDELKGNTRTAILVEAAYFEGFHRRNPVVARRWLHQAAIREVEEQTFLRAAAAVLMAEGLFAEAADSAEAAVEKAKLSLDFGGALAEKAWLKAIRDTCRQRLDEEATRQARES
jgi:hypothetical protein